MKAQRQCPDCSQWLTARNCACGWQESNSTVAVQKDKRCQYQIKESRCSSPASSTKSIHNRSTWYCIEHSLHLDDPMLCETILINSEKNYAALFEARRSWREKLYQDDFKLIKKEML